MSGAHLIEFAYVFGWWGLRAPAIEHLLPTLLFGFLYVVRPCFACVAYDRNIFLVHTPLLLSHYCCRLLVCRCARFQNVDVGTGVHCIKKTRSVRPKKMSSHQYRYSGIYIVQIYGTSRYPGTCCWPETTKGVSTTVNVRMFKTKAFLIMMPKLICVKSYLAHFTTDAIRPLQNQ